MLFIFFQYVMNLISYFLFLLSLTSLYLPSISCTGSKSGSKSTEGLMNGYRRLSKADYPAVFPSLGSSKSITVQKGPTVSDSVMKVKRQKKRSIANLFLAKWSKVRSDTIFLTIQTSRRLAQCTAFNLDGLIQPGKLS